MNKEQFGVFFVVIVPAALLIVAGMLRAFRPAGRVRALRAGRMRQTAGELGLRYYGASDERMLAALPECSLLDRGEARRVANLLSDGRKPPALLVFDYEYSRQRRTADHAAVDALYLVAMARMEGGEELPYACIYRLDWLGGPVGVKDVYRLSAQDDPQFSMHYVLSGRPAHRVRAMLSAPVREAVKSWSLWGPLPVVETLPGWVAVYVESEAGDRHLGVRCAEVARYARSVADALRGQARGSAT
jgi:hypothetical protein